MLPPDPTSPQPLSGGEDSPTENKRKVDIELKMEATRQFFLNDNHQKPLPSTSRRRASMGAVPDSSYNTLPARHFKSAAPIPILGGPHHDDGDGYGTDSEAARPSRRAQARRASLTLKNQMQSEQQQYQHPTTRRSRRASMSEAVNCYDMDDRAAFDPTIYVTASRPKNATSLANPRGRKGINPDALARMSRHESGAAGYGYDDDKDFDYDDEDEDAAAYGYGYACGAFGGNGTPALNGPGPAFGYSLPAPRFERRGSNRSHTSAASRRSRASATSHRSKVSVKRRNSHLLRKDSDSTPPRNTLSDLEPSNASEGDSGASGFGMEANTPNYESAEESETERSFCSNACNRRNSCIGASNSRALAAVEMLDNDDDLDDPDSLLTRSGYFNKMKAGALKHQEKLSLADSHSINKTPGPVPVTAKSRVEPPFFAQQNNQLSFNNSQSWNRAFPFTTSHEPLTKEKLDMCANIPTHDNFGVVPCCNNWDQTSSDDEGSDSEESFGASMYADPIYEEIDRYQQRARRRESIEQSWIDMGSLLEEKGKNKHKKVPDFKPAAGCTNASDNIVRCFTARLRAGLTVIKHNRSRWSKSQLRVLYLLPDGKTLTWKPMKGEVDRGKRPRLDLSKCKEVRHAWTPDPDTRKQVGTATLRKRCKDGTANKSFALIFRQRTLDMTALSTDQCRVLMEGFSALAFRLQMDHLKDDNGSSSGDRHKDVTGRSCAADDDWASTVYGGDSTVSMTQSGLSTATQTQLLSSPWGF